MKKTMIRKLTIGRRNNVIETMLELKEIPNDDSTFFVVTLWNALTSKFICDKTFHNIDDAKSEYDVLQNILIQHGNFEELTEEIAHIKTL